MHMLTCMMKLPYYNMFWQAETCYPTIANFMSNKRYKQLRKYLQIADNTTTDKPKNNNEKLFKIRPVIEAVRENCMTMEPEPVHSIDGQTIPAETKQSGIRI